MARLGAAALLGLLSTCQAATLLASHYSGTVYTLTFTGSSSGAANSGKLSISSQIRAGGSMPSWISLDTDNRLAYVTDESQYGSTSLTALAIAADGSLKVSATAKTSGGELHSGLYGGASGNGFIAVAEYDPSTITTYKLPLSSSSQQVQKLRFTMSGRGTVPSRQDKPHPHSVFTDPTGRFLLSADLGADVIRIFAIDASTGQLKDCPAAQATAGDGPRHGSFWQPVPGNTNGTVLYIVNELGNSMSTWSVTYPPAASASGCLSLRRQGALSTYPAGKSAPSGSKAAEVHVAGNFVYVANRNDQSFGSRMDSMAAFAINPATGGASFLEASSAYTFFPRTFSINKAGDLVATGGQTSATVAVIKRDTTTGKLGPLLATLAVGNPGTVNNEDGLSAVIWNE